MDELTIRITAGAEGGYLYDIWQGDQISDAALDSDDGGLCTTTMENALDMAWSQATELIRRGDECPGCGGDMRGRPRVDSRFGNGQTCPQCAFREEHEGDFIGER